MFEITGEDIARLNDEDLRTLIGQLCEAEVRGRGGSTSAVTWSGNQNAADEGIDVRVELPSGTSIDGFVPRPSSGFQVKKGTMPPGKILIEMCPGGKLRRTIRDLADRSGAYIIVSSGDSTADSALGSRIKKMKEVANDLDSAASLFLDFYDRGRVATWTRSHPGLVLWAREKAGRSITGWRAHGAWAYAPEGEAGEYLLDDQLSFKGGATKAASELRPLEGIHLVRDLLREPGKVGRLIGLSGVGKTRFAQALFDARVGERSLDPSLAIYTNIANSPVPAPTSLLSDLLAAGLRAILVIDNCGPDLHECLSELCRSTASCVSILTIEYDIQDDQPEGTEVFELKSSSIALIEKLIKRRFPTLPSKTPRSSR